jgi:hypothetical protein
MSEQRDCHVQGIQEQAMTMYYCITVQGHLEAHWTAWFDGLTITNAPDGRAVLTGLIVDQAALYGVLVKIRDLGLPLIAVQPDTGPPR